MNGHWKSREDERQGVWRHRVGVDQPIQLIAPIYSAVIQPSARIAYIQYPHVWLLAPPPTSPPLTLPPSPISPTRPILISISIRIRAGGLGWGWGPPLCFFPSRQPLLKHILKRGTYTQNRRHPFIEIGPRGRERDGKTDTLTAREMLRRLYLNFFLFVRFSNLIGEIQGCIPRIKNNNYIII